MGDVALNLVLLVGLPMLAVVALIVWVIKKMQ